MNTNYPEQNFRDLLAAVRRRGRLLGAIAGGIVVFSMLLAILLPAIYRSETVILIEQQEIPDELVRSTVTSYAGQRIQVIGQRVMTSSNLIEIMDKYGLYAEERETEAREMILETMREDIGIEMISADVIDPRSGRPTDATIAFRLSFDNRDPSIAQKVTNELVSLYLNENIKTRTESATETVDFLTQEAERLGRKVNDLEEQLASFKGENVENRPELEAFTRQIMNRMELEIMEIDRRMDAATQQKFYLEGELAQIEPYRMREAGGGVTPLDRLRVLEAELAAAEATYGEGHPDVIRLTRQVEGFRSEVDPTAARLVLEKQLKDARDELATVLENYGAEHPDIQVLKRKLTNLEGKINVLPPSETELPTNPPYISLQARLAAVAAEMRSLEGKRRVVNEKYDEALANIAKIPQAEAEYRGLNRDYENTLAKHREITAKQMEARLSQELETERKGERFTLIEPPSLPEKPARPNRVAILLVGFVFAAAGGFGAVGVAEAIDNRVRGRRGVVELLGVPPLASIPYVPGPDDANQGMRTALYSAGAGAILVTSLILFHVLHTPLDVLWFVVLRKIGF